MSNLRAAPLWANDFAESLSGDVHHSYKVGPSITDIRLSSDEIVQIERIAAVMNARPEEVIAEFVRAAILAIERGGWRVPGSTK